MRKLITLCTVMAACVCVYQAQAKTSYYSVGQGAAAGTSYNTTDMTRGFEVDSDPSGWAETDTGSLLNRYDTGQAHSGTHSMSVANTATTAAYQRYDIGSNKTDVSVCLWHYAPASTAGDDIHVLLSAGQSTGTTTVRVYYTKYSDSYYYRLRGTTFPTGVTAITTGAWYRLEVDITQNNTSTLRIYNAAGTQQGSDITVTASNNAVRYLHFGRVEGAATTGFGVSYMDDIGADWTDATFPLWEYEVAN